MLSTNFFGIPDWIFCTVEIGGTKSLRDAMEKQGMIFNPWMNNSH